MASSGSFNTTGYQGRYLTFEWYVQSQEIASNSTVIVWTLKGAGNAESSYYYTQNIRVTINGTTVYNKPKSEGQVVLYNGTVVATGTYTFTHNAEGNYSFSAYAEAGIYNWAVNCTGSGSFSLPQIPRVSVPTLSANSVYFGSNITIYTNRKSSSFTHHLYYSVNGGAEVGIAPDITDSFTWTVPYELMSNIPNGKSATIMFRLYTFSGGTNIGNNTIEFTATAPDNSTTNPSITISSITPVSSLSDTFASLFIQGKSKVKANFTTAGKYGATIKSSTISVDGKSYGSSKSYTSDYLSSYGEKTVTITTTDSRGISNSVTRTITVIAYSSPKVNVSICERCDANGNLSGSGTYLKISAKRTYSKVMSGDTQNNCCLIRYRYKASASPSYSAWTTILARDSLSSDMVSTGALLDGALSVSTSYQVQIQALDDIGEYGEATINIETETVHTHKAPTGYGFGKYSEVENALDMGWDIELNENDIYKNGEKAFAPAGYGYGVTASTLLTDFNADVPNGRYYTNSTTANCPDSVFENSIIDIQNRYNTNEKVQKIYNTLYACTLIRQTRDGGSTWSEFWENPPVALGVEYRTTERWNGKVVYTKLVNYGGMPGATRYAVSHGVAATNILRCKGVNITTGICIPCDTLSVFADKSTITIISSTTETKGQKAYVQIWYTKN